MTVEFGCQEFSYEIGHSNPERVTLMLANNCTQSTSELHQLVLKDDEAGFITDRSVSWPLYTARLASSSPSTKRARECDAYMCSSAYDKARCRITRTDCN